MPQSRASDTPLTCLARLGAHPGDKDTAIREACQMLAAAGCVDATFEDSMLRREAVAETYLGHGVAIPHGMVEDRGQVRRDGVAILQIPGGVTWNDGQTVHMVVAIAAGSDAHIAMLRRLTGLLQDENRLGALFSTTDLSELRDAFGEQAMTAPAPTAEEAQDLDVSFIWRVDYPSGLHARPASTWVDAARAAQGRIRVRHGGEAADAKALVALLRLGLRAGDEVTISADGSDAQTALDHMRSVITGLSAQEKADAERAAGQARVPADAWVAPANAAATIIDGLGASPGLTIGPVHVLSITELVVPDLPLPLGDGGNRLHEALVVTRKRLEVLADDTVRRLGEAEGRIFTAQAELLNDIDLITLTCQYMVEGHGVAKAWRDAVEEMAKRLESGDNALLAARAADLRDVGRRVLTTLLPDLASGTLDSLPDSPCILLAEDLAPSDTAGLDPNRILGFATVQGGPTSHSAILARTLGLPAVVGSRADMLDSPSGTPAILDGIGGRLYLTPTEDALASARLWLEERAKRAERDKAERGLPATTGDGHSIEVSANVNRPDQVDLALSHGAEGVGLMRTEFLFLERSTSPTEDEQYETYQGMLDALDGRPLIVRALDIGGDKQVPHLDLPREENPFLGVRGARLLLRRPDLLVTQLRALYRAAKSGRPLSIMFPMITSAPEMIRLRAVAERVRADLDAPEVPLGAMVEVPAAAVAADLLARHVDFFSIGTNDLTQYTLAIDRQHPDLAREADSLHPAVLRLIRATVEGAAKHGRWVGVCGGIAGDPFGAALLTGLGVNELSMTPRDIPAVKARIRGTTLDALKALADEALTLETAEEVRALDKGQNQ
ncbi:MAG: phosphoenolpyruvate--protein phosphotransferase [Rhodospirillum sp.]|nr:phosphoenolpyruvate--protein phosphotransferase [Rhodospirillum sp.]MCF8501043.1 phosphoenolpyruvate--protein phosphotransferase [Rhodospirillum sp.]